jgi:hypothetical protein
LIPIMIYCSQTINHLLVPTHNKCNNFFVVGSRTMANSTFQCSVIILFYFWSFHIWKIKYLKIL